MSTDGSVAASVSRRDIDFSEGSPDLHWPHHQVVLTNGTVYLAGQIGIRGTQPAVQAVEIYRRIGHYLQTAGAVPDDVVKETVYLVDHDLLAIVAEQRNLFYSAHWPITTAVTTGRNGGPDIEVEVIAVVGSGQA